MSYVGYLNGNYSSPFITFTNIDNALENCIASINLLYGSDDLVCIWKEIKSNIDQQRVKSYTVRVIIDGNDITHRIDIYEIST